LCLGLAREGASVAVIDIKHEGAQETCEAITAQGGKALGLTLDVAKRDAVREAVRTIVERYSSIDVLVTAAGVVGPAELRAIEEASWDRTLDVNLKGTLFCIQAVAEVMSERRFGRIITITSASVARVRAHRGAYLASKAGVEALTRTAAVELAGHNITVNAISPGLVDTPINHWWMTDKARLERYLSAIPLGRAGRPEDLVEPVLFLASEGASYVTGTVLTVDGGLGIYQPA
jgi:3-oxoacyl-[acyl-carrier protein] reductase